MTTHQRSPGRSDDRDLGISPAAVAALGDFFNGSEETDPVVICHYVTAPTRDESTFTGKRTACGIDGVMDHSRAGTSVESGVTCTACKTELSLRHARDDKRALARVRKAPVHIQKIERDVRDRLVAAGLAKVNGAWVEAVRAQKGAA